MADSVTFRDVESPEKPLNKSYTFGACAVPLQCLTVGDALDAAAIKKPDQVIYIFSQTDETWTFIDLLAKSNLYAKSLLALGIRRGDHVAASGFHDSDFLVLTFAAMQIGAIFSVVKCKVFFLSTKAADDYKNLFTLFSKENNSGEAICERIPSLQHAFVSCDENTPCGWQSIDDMQTLGAGISDQELARAKSAVDIDDPAYAIYTSGSTGDRKAACWSQRTITNLSRMHQVRRNPHRQSMRFALPSPLYEEIFTVVEGVGAAVNTDVDTVCVYGSSEACSPETAWREAEMVQKYRCTHASYYPFVWAAMLNLDVDAKYDMSSLRGGTCGSIAMDEKFCARLASLMPDLVNVYGMSECFNASMTSLDEPMAQRFKSIGKVMPHMEIKLIDSNGNIVPIGHEGELCVRGWATMMYYLYDEEHTRKAKDDAQWLHSGDVCKMDERGTLTYVSRREDCVRYKIYDEAIFPQPIENAVKQHTDVTDAMVVGLLDESTYSHALHLCIISKSGNPISEAELDACFDAKDIADEHRPERVHYMTEFPRTGIRRKISRRLLKQIVEERISKEH